MANYVSYTLTNYFTVTDDTRFKELAKCLKCDEGEVEFDEEMIDGKKMYSLYAYGSMSYYPPMPNKTAEKLKAEYDKIYDIRNVEIDKNNIRNYDVLFDENENEIYNLYDDDESSFEDFLKEIQKILPNDECFVFQEVGHEKLRYLVGIVVVVTKNNIESMSLNHFAKSKVKELLGEDKDIHMSC